MIDSSLPGEHASADQTVFEITMTRWCVHPNVPQ
jgi:hypothetical protein